MRMRSSGFGNVRRLLIRGVNWIGDAVMTTPAVRALRGAFPGAEITMLIKPWAAPVFQHSPHVDRLMLYESGNRHRGWTGKFRLARDLRAFRFDAAVLLQNAFEAAFITAIASIPVRVGFPTDGRRLLLTHPAPLTPALRREHQSEYFLGIVRGMGFAAEETALELAVGNPDRQRARELLSAARLPEDAMLAGINPSAAFGPAKQWPPERYVRLADRIQERYGARILIFGGPGDRMLGQWIAERMRRRPVNLAGQTTLGEAMALIERCRIFVSNDSGLMHVAAALQTPLAAVFGSTNPLATGPRSPAARVVAAGAPCSPCLRPRCPEGHMRCMAEIEVDQVFAAVSELMET